MNTGITSVLLLNIAVSVSPRLALSGSMSTTCPDARSTSSVTRTSVPASRVLNSTESGSPSRLLSM